MSIRKMSEVWEYSRHDGTHLLMLLAIADFADDDGRAYPAVATLARKCRMKPRNAQTILATLRQSGELAIRMGEGPRGTNLYRIPPLQGLAPLQDSAPLQGIARRGAKDCANPLQGLAPKPSVNHQGTTSGANHPSDDPLPCPVQRIIDAYHKGMPANPRVKILNAARRGMIKARWIEASKLTCEPFGYSDSNAGIAAWESFFEICNYSDFLTGKTQPQPGRPPFLAGIDFLMSPHGFAGCLENKYHGKATAQDSRDPCRGAI